MSDQSMKILGIVLIVVGVLILCGIAFMLYYTLPIAKKVFDYHLKREPEKRGLRECTAPDNEEQMAMWEAGKDWANEHKAVMREVKIERDGLNLYGEFYNFGGDRCVIILPGRGECLVYSYYYAEPYRKAGMNVLVVDQRSKGKSDGDYDSVGGKEHQDTIAWIKYIEENFGIKRVWLHGICMGGQGALMVATAENCPESVEGVTYDGAFISFRENFKEHMIYIKKPTFPVLDECMWMIKRYTGTDVAKIAPIARVPMLKKRMLFIHSEQDIFSRPDKVKILFEKCASPDKKLEWFPVGGHSHVRINNLEHYDQTIVDFVNQEA